METTKYVYNCCRECRTIFAATMSLAYCNKHKYIDDAQFSVVEEYVIAHPLCNALEVHKNTNVAIPELIRYIDEGRLSIVDEKICVRKD